jgi:ubiquinone biosynthesis protein
MIGDGVVLASAVGTVAWWVAGGIVAVGTTLLAARFLAVGRGWLQAAIAGGTGWLGALVIAGTLADWGFAPSLFWETALLAVPLTMVLMVGIDLVARPGTLARGDEAGLIRAPHPVAGIRSRVAPFTRYRELVAIMRRHQLGHLKGDPPAADEDLLPPPEVRLREALEDAGGVFVKLGQIAATRIDLLPPQVCAELSRLQSRSTPIPADEVRSVLEAEYGRPAEEVFASFEWEPLAAASIGQTHTALLHSGEAVVVKVQRPGIHDTIERDLGAMDQLARLAERRTVLGRDLQVAGLAREFGRSLRAELDFRREASSTAEMHAVIGADPLIRVPDVYPDLCTRRVMVQERLLGVPLSDLPSDAEVDREALARAFLRTNIDNILHEGLFHADPHPGNVLVLDDGRLGMIDFGATGRLDAIQQQAVIDMLIALVRRDVPLLRDGIERVADVGSHVSRDRFERSLARLLADHARPGGTVDPQALSDLVPLLASFQVTLPGDLVVLLRALITLDGTLGVLSPGFGVVQAGMELAREQAAEHGEDPQEVLEQALLAELPVLRRLPADLGRTLALMSRGTLQFRTVTAEDDDRFLRTLVNRGLLAGIGAALALTSVLLIGLELGPRLGDGPRLVALLGAGGVALGAVLMLRVVAAVVRDGTG